MSIIMKEKGCTASTIGYYLVIVGAVNWGLVGIGHFVDINLNIVSMLLESMYTLESLVYLIIGAAGVMTFLGCKCATCKACRGDAGSAAPQA